MSKRRRRRRKKRNWKGNPIARPVQNQAVGNVSYGKVYCKHWRTPVTLLDGVEVTASAYFDEPKNWEVEYDEQLLFVPDIGFYLDEMWGRDGIYTTPNANLPWVNEDTYNSTIRIIYPWMDAWVPEDTKEVTRAFQWLIDMAREGYAVDIGCLGGHGRTGSALAGMLVLQGMPAWKAVDTVRSQYCQEAVETAAQERFVLEVETIRTGKDPESAPNGHTPLGIIDKKPIYVKNTATRDTNPIDKCPICNGSVFHWKTHTDTHINKSELATDSYGLFECVWGCGCKVSDQEKHQSYNLCTKYVAMKESLPSGWKARQTDDGWEAYDAWEARKSGDDDADYALWQKLNGPTSIVEFNEMEHCMDPPCMYPGDCDIGDCWKARVAGSMEIRSDYMEFSKEYRDECRQELEDW